MRSTMNQKDQSVERKRAQMYTFMYDHPVGILSTVTPDNDPHSSVVYYTPDENNNILFFTKALTKKHDNITHNNHVMLLVYDSRDQTVLQVMGTAELVQDDLERQMDFAAVMNASMIATGYAFSPISKIQAGPYRVYKIIPGQLRMTTYGYLGHGTEILDSSTLREG